MTTALAPTRGLPRGSIRKSSPAIGRHSRRNLPAELLFLAAGARDQERRRVRVCPVDASAATVSGKFGLVPSRSTRASGGGNVSSTRALATAQRPQSPALARRDFGAACACLTRRSHDPPPRMQTFRLAVQDPRRRASGAPPRRRPPRDRRPGDRRGLLARRIRGNHPTYLQVAKVGAGFDQCLIGKPVRESHEPVKPLFSRPPLAVRQCAAGLTPATANVAGKLDGARGVSSPWRRANSRQAVAPSLARDPFGRTTLAQSRRALRP